MIFLYLCFLETNAMHITIAEPNNPYIANSMVDTYSDETGVLDFTRTQNGAGMSNRAAAKALINVMQRQFKVTLNNLFTVADIQTLAQVHYLNECICFHISFSC